MSLRWILITSVIVVCSVALITFLVILARVIYLKKQIKKVNEEYKQKEIFSKGHQKVIQRDDFLEIDYDLKEKFKNSKVSDESIEFCINSIIKNSIQKVLIPNTNSGYEIFSLLKKTEAKIYLFANNQKEFLDPYLKENNWNKRVEYIENPSFWEKKQSFDSIILFNSSNYFDDFSKFFEYLQNEKMLIIVNAKKDKQSKKLLYKHLLKTKIRFELLNWSDGFFLVVKN